MKYGLPQCPSEAVIDGLLRQDDPPSKFLKLWNDEGWWLPEQLNKTKVEMDELVEKEEYRKTTIQVHRAYNRFQRTKRAIYQSLASDTKRGDQDG